MLGSFTEPVKLDADTFPRNAVSASVNSNDGLAVTVKLTQRDQVVYLTRSEIAALVGLAQ